MNKAHLIKVIEAIEAITILDNTFVKLTGTDLGVGECSAIYGLWDIIVENAKSEYRINNEASGDGIESLYDVLKNDKLSATEKYMILIGE